MPALGLRIASSSASLPSLPPIEERSGPVDFFPSPSLWHELHFGPVVDVNTRRPRRASPSSVRSLRTDGRVCLFLPAKGGSSFSARALIAGLRLVLTTPVVVLRNSAGSLPACSRS